MIKMNSRLFEEANGGEGGQGGGGGGAPAASPSLFPAASATPAASAPADQTPAATPASAPADAPAGTAPAWFGEIFTADGKVNGAAFDRLPENLKQFRTTFEQYKTPEALFHALGHTKQLVGQKALTKLDANAPQEARDAQSKVIREVLGVPEKPEGYGLKKPDQLPEGTAWDEKGAGEFAALAHKHNAPPELVHDIIKWHTEKLGQGAAASVAETAKTREAELGKLDALIPAGSTRADYIAKAEKGMGVASRLTGIPVDQLKAKAVTALDVQLLHAFAEVTAEDKLIDAGTDVATKGYEEKIKELMNSADYTSSEESKRKPVLAEISRLTALQHKITK